MGTAALLLTVGGESNQKINMYKLAIFCVAIVGAFAAPNAEADADAYYGYYPALYNAYPNWPGVSTPFASSTCFGCRGKRSADAEADADAYYGYGYYPYYRAFHYPGVAGHPGAATSFVARSPQGLGKRSADAEPGYLGYGLHPYGYGVPILTAVNGAHHGISQLHPTGHSFQSVVRGKRSADADAYYRYGYGYPYAHRAYGYGYGYGYGYYWG